MLPDKEDHVEIGLSRLKQIRRKPIIEGILKSFLVKIQDVEDTAEFYKNLSIFNATGYDLDRIGNLFNVPRLSRADEYYRPAILAYIASTLPNCSIEGIMEAVKAFGQTTYVDLWEHYPAHLEVYMGAGFSPDMYSVLKQMAPAGVSVCVLIDSEGDSLVLSEEAPENKVLVTHAGEGLDLEVEAGVFKTLAVSSSGDYLEYKEAKSAPARSILFTKTILGT